MHRHVRSSALFLLFALLVSACAARAGRIPENGDADRARVTVINRANDQLTIYVARGAERHRLGIVSPGSQQTWMIPQHLILGVSALSFTAETPGGQRVLAQATHNVAPGTHVEMIVR